MRKTTLVVFCVTIVTVALAGCEQKQTSESRDAKRVMQQQDQYEKSQPVPVFDWSLERHLVIELYRTRNQKVATHSVWRSDYGLVEGDCPSMGYGLPYDTSLTNPLVATNIAQTGEQHTYQGGSLTSIEQAEPNGVFASKNTSATWVFCIGESGSLEPVYVESKVTVYPGPVKVDYDRNRVTRSGAATVLIRKE
ncbi:MAG: hypothetical protein A3J55_04560 [Candidatus Ryanbacteria bacterium RIFCSPHIGHO2_02_FULL_45_17b]|uniref:Lipoprotein n=1 Tax=Candidatus Ryanbacteria bacterium RIFCSPHIGHO2_01_FULL_45_22 TaxID=1802114 RepID=A0A1G2G2E2_9BACT|nr:MAG: hypothetical protein A2719_05135 [Candidatus Ryanbacteria bacterium RIFCSPHIGHO2_01_FULL_45_22]OGZ47615.1 MAG: hypothetical protein A3J55_04560 [Candidatus Ryanbacteria bacterium RIFCSPHIGHO2_02_FULL_45_17b]